MPNGLVVSLTIAGVVAVLALLLGRIAGVRWRWLAAGVGLLLVHDAMLTGFYGALPSLLPGERNWQGKLLALGLTLAVAALPAFGWRRSGLTLAQAPGSLRSALPVAAVYALVFGALSIAMGGGDGTTEDLAYQLTLPGLEEEPFYRGVLLLALDRALPGRWRFAGVDWGWGAVLTSLAFGLDHALSFGRVGYDLDPLYLALTALPSLVAVWIRYRTGSLLIPVLLHNWGNSAGHLI